MSNCNNEKCARKIVEAKHRWPIVKEKEHQNKGVWEKWINKEIDDIKFVDLMIHIIKLGWTGITKDTSVRNGIMSAIRNFQIAKNNIKDPKEYKNNYSETARMIGSWLAAGENVNEELVSSSNNWYKKAKQENII